VTSCSRAKAERHGKRMLQVGMNIYRAGYEAGRAEQQPVPADGVPLVTRAVDSIHVRLTGLGFSFEGRGEDARTIVREEIERLIRDAIDMAGKP
jgi:hypothetical protein